MENKMPMILVFAGPNGSGKSTFTKELKKVGTYTNADELVVKKKISNKEAGILVDEKRYTSIKEKKDFTFETVLSSTYKIDMLKKAKEDGYFIKCIFVLTRDSSVNVLRVKARVEAGGHDVPEQTIRDRYSKALKNIRILIELCDILHVYDNTIEPTRIIRKHKDDITIFPNELWEEEDILELIQ